MSDQAIRSYVIQQLQAITGQGSFYDYSRYPKNNETGAFLDLFRDKSSNQIIGWEMQRIGVPQIVRASNVDFKVTHTYQLEGYLSVEDTKASEKTFNLWIDAIVQKLIDITIPNEQGLHLPKVSIIGHKSFGQVLCHYASIEWPVAELVEKTALAQSDLLALSLSAYLTDNTVIADNAIMNT